MQFISAHPKAQARFWQNIRAHVEREHVAAANCFAMYGVWPVGYDHRLPRWGPTWTRRSQWYRDTDADPELLDAQHRRDNEWYRLHDIPAPEYVEELAQVELDSRGKCRCPLLGHNERTASFNVWPDRWHCFGCGQGGRIYEFAAALWGLETRGPDFNAIHKRLTEVFLAN